MADSKTIKTAYERNKKAVTLRPEMGKSTAVTNIRLFNGTTCEVEHKHWKFKVDIGTGEGGNDAGPGPGILERGALGSGGSGISKPVDSGYHCILKTRTMC